MFMMVMMVMVMMVMIMMMMMKRRKFLLQMLHSWPTQKLLLYCPRQKNASSISL